jgi:ubiquinol-cytochrome c reductase cytochrome b subunit
MVRGQLSPDHRGAELGAPADPSTAYSAARPEWYFLFLFQLLKLFEGSGETGERIGTIFIPGFIMLVLFLMPLIGRWKLGHRFNVEFLLGMLLAVAGLTAVAWWEDHRANWTDATQFAEIAELSRQLGQDEQKITAHFGGDAAKIAEYHRRLRPYEAYRKSLGFLAAVKQAVEEAQRACQLASGPHRIPASGALSLLREDPLTEGPRLFQQNCTGCHCYFNPDDVETPAARDQLAKASAPNLYGFGSRRWLAGLLNAESIAGPQYYGATTKYKKLKATGKSLEMVDYVVSDVSSWPADEVKQIAAALSAQAQLPAQQELDQQDQAVIDAGAKLIADTKRCASCHRFDAKLPAGDPKLSQNDTGYPDLTHYGSREWMSGMICNPRAPRFYGEQNDRMPAFAPHEQAVEQNRLSRRQIELIVDWLRGDYLQPAPPAPGD